MTALLHAELLKLRTTRTFIAVVAIASALSVVLVALATILAAGREPSELFTNNAITYIIVLLGAIGMTGEWRHRTITGTVLAAPDRLRLLAAKAIAYSVAGVVLTLLVSVATMIVGTVILGLRGEDTLGPGGLADLLWRNLAVAAVLGPMGVAVGALIRNQIVTVVGMIAVAAVVEPAILQVSPHLGRFGPLAGAPAGVLGSTDPGTLAPGFAFAVLIVWAGVAFAAAAARLRRRDLV